MRRLLGLSVGLGTAVWVAFGPCAIAFADEAASGDAVFKKYCIACHAPPQLDKNMRGPSLHGVVGRHIARAPGYGYSKADANSDIVWTESELDIYLTNPKAAVQPHSTHPGGPVVGTNMTFSGIKDAAERKAVIAYLKAN